MLGCVQALHLLCSKKQTGKTAEVLPDEILPQDGMRPGFYPTRSPLLAESGVYLFRGSLGAVIM